MLYISLSALLYRCISTRQGAAWIEWRRSFWCAEKLKRRRRTLDEPIWTAAVAKKPTGQLDSLVDRNLCWNTYISRPYIVWYTVIHVILQRLFFIPFNSLIGWLAYVAIQQLFLLIFFFFSPISIQIRMSWTKFRSRGEKKGKIQIRYIYISAIYRVNNTHEMAATAIHFNLAFCFLFSFSLKREELADESQALITRWSERTLSRGFYRRVI